GPENRRTAGRGREAVAALPDQTGRQRPLDRFRPRAHVRIRRLTRGEVPSLAPRANQFLQTRLGESTWESPRFNPTGKCSSTRRFDLGRLWAYARRETMELIRDPIRMTFAALAPPIVM